MSNIKDFNFYQFLLDISNQSIDPLQGNERYNDLVRGMENIFNKLYRRVQEIGILNTLDLNSDRDFVKYLPENEKTDAITGATQPYKDLILEQLSLYLDTDHFKDTVAMMMRLYQKRKTDGGLLGPNEETLEDFIEQHIIPSFKFFTMNAGDLHKSKGTIILLERLFEFYGEVSKSDKIFDGIMEHDSEDVNGRRFRRFSSLREGVTLKSLLKNYSNIQIFQNANFQITDYVELETHKFVLADGYLFISRRDREDWHIINIVDNIYRLNKYYLVIKQYKTLTVYSDRVDIYDSTTNEFVLPEVLPSINITNVEFVPKIINIEDKFNQYHDNNLYFIDMYIKPSGGFGCFEYNLKRIRYREEFDYITTETIQLKMGITYLADMYSPIGTYPIAEKIKSVDYLWLNFYDADTTETFEFYPNPLLPESYENVKLAYSFVIKEIIKVATAPEPEESDPNFDYPIKQFVCMTRDGYNYDHITNGFQYKVLNFIPDDLVQKYVVQERYINNIFESELNKIIGDDVKVQTVLDFFLPTINEVRQTKTFTDQGFWDANNIDGSVPSLTPSDGDYWTVSNAGNIELNGITIWEYGDIVSWNARHEFWEKNNDLKIFSDSKTTNYIMDHRMLVFGDKEFLNDDMIVNSPYERGCSIFEIQLSSISFNIDNFSKLFWIDTNAIEKFGDDAIVLFSYIDKTNKRYMIHSVIMSGFAREHVRVDINRVLKGFPTNDAGPVVYKIEVTDKHLIVYCSRFTRISSSKSTAIICEDTNYNLPFGFRSNRMNVYYNADVRLETRSRQPFFREWSSLTSDQLTEIKNSQDCVNCTDVVAEEVEAFKNTLGRYAPINTDNNLLQENIDVGISSQVLEDGTTVDDFPVAVINYEGTKQIKEISKLSMRDIISLRIDGDPENPNCDCGLQNAMLFLHDFEPMTLFYDFVNSNINPGLSDVPSCVPAYKVGKVQDEFSSFQSACRFDTNWFYYQYDDGVSTIPRLVRSRFRVNLFDTIQRVVIPGASTPLAFNWSVHCLIEVFADDPLSTVAEWVTATSEEIFAALRYNAECIPILTYYTSDNTVPLETIVDPWDIYNIQAMKIDKIYNCNYTPWTPNLANYTRYHSEYPELPIVEETPPVRTSRPNNIVTFEVWMLNSWLEGFSATGNIVSDGVSYPVDIELVDGYSPDPELESNQYSKRLYTYTIGTSSSIAGTQINYTTEAENTHAPRVGRMKIFVGEDLIYDTGFINGKIAITL